MVVKMKEQNWECPACGSTMRLHTDAPGLEPIKLSRETARTLYEIYVRSDDLCGAASSTISAVKELMKALGLKAQGEP